MNEDVPKAPQQDKANQDLDKMMKDMASEIGKEAIKESKSVNTGALKETLINYIVPLVSGVLTLLIIIFVLLPSYNNLPELRSQLENKSRLKRNLELKIDNLTRLSDFKNVVDENSQLVSRVLVSEQLVPNLLTQVDKISQEAGFSINRLNYGLGVTTQIGGTGDVVTYNFVTVNLGVNGSFEQLKTFLSRLENAARIIDVDKFRYTLSESDTGDFLGINFVLSSPYLFVESDAVTDEPVDLDISNPEFVDLINRLKNLNYYDPSVVDTSVPVVEATEEDELEDLTGEELVDEAVINEEPPAELLQGGGETLQGN